MKLENIEYIFLDLDSYDYEDLGYCRKEGCKGLVIKASSDIEEESEKDYSVCDKCGLVQ